MLATQAQSVQSLNVANLPVSQDSATLPDAPIDLLGLPSSNPSAQVEYFMSTGALGNRSQPDDLLAHILYSLFSQPLATMIKLRKLALSVLLF